MCANVEREQRWPRRYHIHRRVYSTLVIIHTRECWYHRPATFSKHGAIINAAPGDRHLALCGFGSARPDVILQRPSQIGVPQAHSIVDEVVSVLQARFLLHCVTTSFHLELDHTWLRTLQISVPGSLQREIQLLASPLPPCDLSCWADVAKAASLLIFARLQSVKILPLKLQRLAPPCKDEHHCTLRTSKFPSLSQVAQCSVAQSLLSGRWLQRSAPPLLSPRCVWNAYPCIRNDRQLVTCRAGSAARRLSRPPTVEPWRSARLKTFTCSSSAAFSVGREDRLWQYRHPRLWGLEMPASR